METDAEYFARIGSHDAMEERHALRLSGKINAPIKRKRVTMAGKDPHKLECQCDECIPPAVREWIKTRPVVTPGMYNAIPRSVTVIDNGADKAPKRRKGKWEQRGSSGN